MSSEKYLITLASSHFGSLAIDFLLKENIPAKNIIATVRDSKKGEKLKEKGIEIRIADYSKPETLKEAFKGVDKLLFISGIPGQAVPRDVQHKNVIEAAKACGIKYMAYTSLINCEKNPAILSGDHKATEKMIKESGIKYSLLRNNWYLENDELLWKLCANEGKDLYNALGEQKIGYALRREYAEAAAKILAKKNPKEIYELTGKPRTLKEVGETLKKIAKKDFKIVDVPKEKMAEKMKEAGYPEYILGTWSFMINDYLKGCLNFESNDLKEALGREPTSLEDGLKELLH